MSETLVQDNQWRLHQYYDIKTWSSCKVLWSLHHSIVVAAQTPFGLYRSLAEHGGFTGPAQEHAVSSLLLHDQPFSLFVDSFRCIYLHWNISHLAHNPQMISPDAEVAAHTLIITFQEILDQHLEPIVHLSTALANGECGYLHNLQQMLLAVAAQHIQELVAIRSFLVQWEKAVQEN